MVVLLSTLDESSIPELIRKCSHADLKGIESPDFGDFSDTRQVAPQSMLLQKLAGHIHQPESFYLHYLGEISSFFVPLLY
jgi:hypothetical protein